MGLLADMLKALERVRYEKNCKSTPKRIAELERRVADTRRRLTEN
jgi:hypothetical protein